MKASVIKKMMVAALAVTLTVTPSLGVMASGNQSAGSGNQTSQSSDSSSSSSKTKEEAVVEAVNENLAAAEDNNGGGVSSVSSVAQIPTTSSVAGVKTSVAGVYLATSVNGCAVTTGLSSISSSYGLAAGEKPYARFYNLEAKRSPLAKAAIDNAAASLNATVGPYVNIELGKMAGGKYRGYDYPAGPRPRRAGMKSLKNFREPFPWSLVQRDGGCTGAPETLY